jgi:hypothetical protein
MIGIVARPAEQAAVREFFELFKTPWEFYRADCPYEVLMLAAGEYLESQARLVLIFGGEETAFDKRMKVEVAAQSRGTVLAYDGERMPVYGNCVTFRNEGACRLVDEVTQRAAAFAFHSAGKVILRVGFDLFQEVHFLLTLGQPVKYAGIPTLELHIALLRDLILQCGVPVVEIPPTPPGYDFIVCLTHDVDHPGIRYHKFDHTMFGFLYRALVGSTINFCVRRMSLRKVWVNWVAAFTLPFVYLGIAKDFWSGFDRYLQIEKGLGSTFFVIPRKDYSGLKTAAGASKFRATRYDVTDIEAHLQKLVAGGCELGLHGIDAWADSSKGREESRRVSRIAGTAEVGVRMHWLFFDEKSPVALENAGFLYDSTFGYNETVGFRAGTTQAYKPLTVSFLLELPLHVMDTALFYPAYLNLTEKDAIKVVRKLVQHAVRFGGALTFNWHDRSILPERLWDDYYLSLLDQFKRMEVWFPTAGQAVSWFRKRRSAAIEAKVSAGREVRVKASVRPSTDSLPNLRVRVHKPSTTGSSDALWSRQSGGFVDFTLVDEVDTSVAI